MSTLSEKAQKRLEEFLLKQEEKKLKDKLKKKKKKVKKKKKLKSEKNEHIVKKRKVGRPKKRGPKKKRTRKKIIKIKKERPLIDFKIISTLNGRQNGYIGSYYSYTDAYNKLLELEKENNCIIFPRKFINSGNINLLKDEYLLLEKNRNGNKNDGLLRNEYGKFVEHRITNNNNWVIRDKIIKFVEETFWVYGFDPKKDRKTFLWIYNNLILDAIETKYDIIRIMIYKNKLLIKYDNKPMAMVLCKNKSDSIRMYNIISNKIRENNLKQIVCTGIYNKIGEARKKIEKEIMDITGWNKIKVQRSTN